MDTNVNVPEKKKKENLTESRARRLTNKSIKMKKEKKENYISLRQIITTSFYISADNHTRDFTEISGPSFFKSRSFE